MNAASGATDVVKELRGILAHAMTHDPRSLQKRIGPSELGTPCERCLVHKLAGTPRDEREPWLPTIGRAFHEWAEMSMIQHLAASGSADWLPEAVVTVGDVDGTPITGTADVFHVPSGTVIDYKLVGVTTLKSVRTDGSGCKQTYQVQGDLYGLGFERLGYTVRNVAIWFLPRSAMSLSQARLYSAPYNRERALWAIERADRFAKWIRLFGRDAILDPLPPHTDTEFSCKGYPDYVEPTAPTNGDPFA